MSALSAGADAAYIYEEKFGIRDLEVNVQLRTNSKDNGLKTEVFCLNFSK